MAPTSDLWSSRRVVWVESPPLWFNYLASPAHNSLNSDTRKSDCRTSTHYLRTLCSTALPSSAISQLPHGKPPRSLRTSEEPISASDQQFLVAPDDPTQKPDLPPDFESTSSVSSSPSPSYSKQDPEVPPPPYSESLSPIPSFLFAGMAAAGSSSIITQVQQGGPTLNTLAGISTMFMCTTSLAN